MKILLDMHTFLWWLGSPAGLSQPATIAISHPNNVVFVSVITLWEIAIKRSIGKLHAPIDLESVVNHAGFQLLSMDVGHIITMEQLPLHHRDPFDRILIAQTIQEDATIVTRDPQFSMYNVQRIVA